MQAQPTADAGVTEGNVSGTDSEITVVDFVVPVALTLALFISFGIALRFRELYREDDGYLSPPEPDNPKEATP